MVRGKKRIGYELEFKISLEGVTGGKWDGLKCSFDFSDFCDDGSEPDYKLFITKDSSKGSGPRFREEVKAERVHL